MPCLFGDATRSELDPDYLHFLRDFVGFAVDVLLAAERIEEVGAALESGRQTAEVERRKLTALQERLSSALRDGGPPTDGVAERTTEAIERACEGVIADEILRLERELTAERGAADRSRAIQRKACERALERLLMSSHTLPESSDELELSLAGDSGYTATLHGRTPYGLEVEIELDIAEGNLFAAVVRASQVTPSLELHLPENRGWINKKVKLVKHRLARHQVSRLRIGDGRVTASLRQPDGGDGYDLLLDSDWTVPKVVVISGDEPTDLSAVHELEERDESAVRELLTTLVDAAAAVRGEPSELSRAVLDGGLLVDHDDPSVLVDRMIELIAPTVRAICNHSLAGDELVLKRELGVDRREEIYLSKQELVDKIEALGTVNRARFDAFGLRTFASVGAAAEKSAPPPAPPAPPAARSKARGTMPPPPPSRTPAEARPSNVIVSPGLEGSSMRAESEA